MRKLLSSLTDIITMPLTVAALGGLALAWGTTASDLQLYVTYLVIGLGPAAIHETYLFLTSRYDKLELDRDELVYTFSFALLTVIFGTQLYANQNWMLLSMCLSVYHGLNLVVSRYYHQLDQRVGMVILWSTILIDKVSPMYTLGYLLLVPIIWKGIGRKRTDFLQIIWAVVVGLAAAILTWLY
jgi:hypothetical protein